MSLIEAPTEITTVQAEELITVLFENYSIPDFDDNLSAILAGLQEGELWRSPDNKIRVVIEKDKHTGFNLNLSRPLSFLRRLF